MSFLSAIRVVRDALFLNRVRTTVAILCIVLFAGAVASIGVVIVFVSPFLRTRELDQRLESVGSNSGATRCVNSRTRELDQRLESVGRNLILIRPAGPSQSGPIVDSSTLTPPMPRPFARKQPST